MSKESVAWWVMKSQSLSDDVWHRLWGKGNFRPSLVYVVTAMGGCGVRCRHWIVIVCQWMVDQKYGTKDTRDSQQMSELR